jgi:hypothetical protein
MEVPAPSPNEPGAKTKPDGDGIGALNDGIGEDKITMPDLFKGEISLGNLMMQNTKDIIKAISSANNADKTQPCTVTEITSIGTSLSTSSSKAGGGGGAPGVTAAQLFIPATLPFGTQVTP